MLLENLRSIISNLGHRSANPDGVQTACAEAALRRLDPVRAHVLADTRLHRLPVDARAEGALRRLVLPPKAVLVARVATAEPASDGPSNRPLPRGTAPNPTGVVRIARSPTHQNGGPWDP